MSRLNYHHLHYFWAVAKEGHLTRAAEALHVTQPAVTGQIKALEEELGIALFDRRPGRIALTRAGERLLPEAEKVLAAAGSLLGQARELQGEVSGSLVIGTVGDPDSLRLGSLLGGLVSALPLLEIKTRSGDAEALREAVATSTLGASFYIGPNIPRDVNGLPLQTLHYRIAAPFSFSHQVLHGPTAVSACESCHESVDPAAHSFKMKRPGRQLCDFCHIDKTGTEGPIVHKPVADGDCTGCQAAPGRGRGQSGAAGDVRI